MRTRFQLGLDDLRQRLLRMGGLAEQAVDRARQAYVERDLTRCQMVLEGEAVINTAEREIDEAAFDLLAMQQPMAVDLPTSSAWAIRRSTSPNASWTWWNSPLPTFRWILPAWARR